MIAIAISLLIVGAWLFCWALYEISRQRRRAAFYMRLSAAIAADDQARKYNAAEAHELNATRWDGD